MICSFFCILAHVGIFFSVIIPASDEYVNIKYNIFLEMEVKITLHDWSKLCVNQEIMSIRHNVFVKEQKVPPEEEPDAFDAVSLHILVYIVSQNGTLFPVATGRLLPDGHIGRVAVLRPYRHLGIGKRVMFELEKQAKIRGMDKIELDAQLQAIPFYERLGYGPYGNIFTDAGILHRKMRKNLNIQNEENT